MPIVALIKATAVETRVGGSSSRMMLMPTAMTEEPRPCSARPPSINSNDPSKAQMTDPISMAARATTSMRRLPYMSAMRATIGVDTAALSRVIVTSHEASAGPTPSSSGKSGSSGMTKVKCSDATMPLSDSTRMVAQAGTERFI